jgi:hypothetical protein
VRNIPVASDPDQLIINPIDVNASDKDKADALGALSKESEKFIAPLIKEIDAFLQTKSLTNTKTKASIIAKGNRPNIRVRKSWFRVEHLRDSFRFKTVVARFSQIVEATAHVLPRGCEVVKFDGDKIHTPSIWGWRVVVFDLRFPNKQLVEWYLPFEEMDALNLGGNHAMFEKWRNKTEQELMDNLADYMSDLKKSRDAYDAAFATALSRQGLDPGDLKSAYAPFYQILTKLGADFS